MRVLIDECVDPRVKLLLADHQAATVHEKGWDALEDGPLLALAQNEFDVLLTIEGSLEFQQNLAKLRMAIVVVHVAQNQLAYYHALREELLTAIARARAGGVVHGGGARRD
jgi:hypothetical protein